MSYKPYKFVTWEVPPPPNTERTRLLEKVHSDEPLTKEEKDKVGVFEAARPWYDQGGWRWRMKGAKQLRRILAKVEHYGWLEYYAVSKTHLRRWSKGGHAILEMVYIDRKKSQVR